MVDGDFELLPLRLAYPFLELHGLKAEADVVRKSREHLGGYTTTLKRARLAELLRRDGLLEKFISLHWPHGATPEGQQIIKGLERIYDRYKTTGATIDEEEPELEETEPAGFAYEAHLRDYLAVHLSKLESGLSLWPVGPEADAIEYPVGARRIDILAKDRDGIPVVIELKVSRGHERTVGQCLYYRAKVREIFKQDTVRIFIVAQQVDDELKVATRELNHVELFEYTLAMNVTRLGK